MEKNVSKKISRDFFFAVIAFLIITGIASFFYFQGFLIFPGKDKEVKFKNNMQVVVDGMAAELRSADLASIAVKDDGKSLKFLKKVAFKKEKEEITFYISGGNLYRKGPTGTSIIAERISSFNSSWDGSKGTLTITIKAPYKNKEYGFKSTVRLKPYNFSLKSVLLLKSAGEISWIDLSLSPAKFESALKKAVYGGSKIKLIGGGSSSSPFSDLCSAAVFSDARFSGAKGLEELVNCTENVLCSLLNGSSFLGAGTSGLGKNEKIFSESEKKLIENFCSIIYPESTKPEPKLTVDSEITKVEYQITEALIPFVFPAKPGILKEAIVREF